MPTRHATCNCGQLSLAISGEPVRVSMCHCLECQRRTGAVMSTQARYPEAQVTVTGRSSTWARKADSGNTLTYHFCPTCGATVFWRGTGFPGQYAVAVGNFADPAFPAPAISVWEETRHPWLGQSPDMPKSRHQKQG